VFRNQLEGLITARTAIAAEIAAQGRAVHAQALLVHKTFPRQPMSMMSLASWAVAPLGAPSHCLPSAFPTRTWISHQSSAVPSLG
jgi:hypothetical protein